MVDLHTLWPAVGFLAGFCAGGINVVVGAGTLVSFPLLLLAGFPPLTATVANTVGIVPGSASGVVVYRNELRTRRGTVALLLPASSAGGVVGALLLLGFPSGVFTAVVPWLVGLGTLLVLLGPSIRRAVAARDMTSGAAPTGQSSTTPSDGPAPAFSGCAATAAGIVGAFVLGIYGGYFSAAQGILLIGLLGIISRLEMQDLNAIKNLTVLGVNVIAAAVFVVVSPSLIDWPLAACIAVGAVFGGGIGGRFAKRLSPAFLRGFVVIVGVGTSLFMLVR